MNNRSSPPKAGTTSATTEVFAVIGDPISHSLSPAMHNAAFRALGMDSAYVAFRVRRSDLGRAVGGVRSLGIAGVNVTMPHKTSIIRFLDDVEETARRIGAINTVVRNGHKLEGHNTDGPAALASLADLGGPLSGSSVLILGAGGAARSIVYYLSEVVENIVILNRTRSKASRIASNVRTWSGTPCRAGPLSKVGLREETNRATLLVNTLPPTVFPRYANIISHDGLIRPGMVILDVNYHTGNGFLAQAKLAGAKATDGLDMLVRQAALSFRLWTGKDAPIEVMREAAINAKRGAPK